MNTDPHFNGGREALYFTIAALAALFSFYFLC